MARAALLTAVAGAIIAANWLRLEHPRTDGWRAALLVALAVAVAIVPPLWRRVAAAAIASFAALAVAFSVSPTRLWPDGAGFFARVANRFGSGFLDFYDFRLPIDPVEHRRMHMVLLVALFAFTLAVGLFLVGAGWPATLLTGGNELGRGAVLLAGALALLAGVSGRAGKLAVPVAAAVVLGALALSSSPAVAKSAFLDWQHWDFYNRPEKPVSVEYVWSTDFQPLHFPKKATTVLRVAGPRTPMYWRATVLERFARDRWLEQIRSET